MLPRASARISRCCRLLPGCPIVQNHSARLITSSAKTALAQPQRLDTSIRRDRDEDGLPFHPPPAAGSPNRFRNSFQDEVGEVILADEEALFPQWEDMRDAFLEDSGKPETLDDILDLRTEPDFTDIDGEEFISFSTEEALDALGMSRTEEEEVSPFNRRMEVAEAGKAREIRRSRPQRKAFDDQLLSTPLFPNESIISDPEATISPYRPPARPSTPRQPHDFPLLSRNDWRLSSPLPLPRPSLWEPPNLLQAARSNQVPTGVNKLVGVGLDPGAETRRYSSTKDERWGWKVRVPESEKGGWLSCDEYIKKPERLIALSREADEKHYVDNLARLGSPERRENMGRCITSAVGRWVGEAAREGSAEEAMLRRQQNSAEKKKSNGKSTIVSVWRRSDDAKIVAEEFKFFLPGTVLRFCPLAEQTTTRPQPPSTEMKNFVQGTLLEIKDGELIVSFAADDQWELEDSEEYQIDLGLDDSAYAIQEIALENLYYDPAHQRKHNQLHVLSAQQAHLNGTTSTLREWTLQGTELRELLVPDLNESMTALPSEPSTSSALGKSHPLVELSHLQLPSVPTIRGPRSEEPANPTTLLRDNQMINSWIKRHSRDRPLTIPGDPDLGLNESQTKAVAMALGERLSLIQGPPGTGKSQTIVSIITLLKSHFRVPFPILLSGPTHVATDHLLALCIKSGLNPLRLGHADRVREDLQQWTVERRREKHGLWKKLEDTRLDSEEKRVRWVDERQKLADGRSGKSKSQIEAIVEQTQKFQEEYVQAWRRFVALEQRLHASLLGSADVFCATAIGAGQGKIANMLDFPMVFLDEAAMCTEPVTLIPLMKGCEQAVLIGDHKQLPAVVQSQEAKKERLHDSLFERLMNQKSVKSQLLDTQYRMTPSISAFPNFAFYNSALFDSPTVQNRSKPPPLSHFLTQSSKSLPPLSSMFISHTHPEETYRRSTVNRPEIDIVVNIVGDLLMRNPNLSASEIGIISPYAAQTSLLRDEFVNPYFRSAEMRLGSVIGPQRASQVNQVEVNTVDGFQGREKGVIILSTVRSNKSGQIGFLTDRRRLNVALTRAKDALFVVGNARTLESAAVSDWYAADADAEVGIWRRYVGWMRERGLFREWDEGLDALV
ncbi:P-loop containing nucleoside triphosphate hydrolase protein [Meredithblackwellia eburnea MCA 4105]